MTQPSPSDPRIHTYVTCPFCGMNRVLKQAEKVRLPDPRTNKVIVYRKQYPREKGGKSKGFPAVGGETIGEAVHTHRKLLERIRDQGRKVLRELMDNGV